MESTNDKTIKQYQLYIQGQQIQNRADSPSSEKARILKTIQFSTQQQFTIYK